MKGNRRLLLLIMMLSFALFNIGCSSTEDKNPVEDKDKQNIELTLETIMDKEDVTFEELEKIAVEHLGKGSEIDKESSYMSYKEDEKMWYYIKRIPDIVGTNKDISELPQDTQDSDLDKITFLIAYYDYVQRTFDEFVEGDLARENAYEEFQGLYLELQSFIYGSYVEGESEQAIATNLYQIEAIGREAREIYEMINISQNVEDETERKQSIDKENKARLDSREEMYDYVFYYYNELTGENE